MNSQKNVLFLGHEATRTGAPLLLLELVKWISSNSDLKPSLLLKRGGEIQNEYQNIAPARCWTDDVKKLNSGLHRRVWRKLVSKPLLHPNLPLIYPAAEYPLVYTNTIDTCDLAMRLAGPGRRIIQHVHELAYCTTTFGVTESLKQAVSATHIYIAASHAVREFLENTIEVPSSKIHVIHEFPIAIAMPPDAAAARRTMRQQLGIAEDAFVIGMCGSIEWRKSPDIFVQLALQLRKFDGLQKCRLVWLGGSKKTQAEVAHDIARAGLREVCLFVPAVRNPEAYFAAFDLFALTSREDPFPVAMLEAAACGLPIVCFAGGGGAPELVEDDAGIIVPYLDVMAMAKACAALFADDEHRKKLGKKARDKVHTRYSLAVQGPKLLGVIESAFSSPKQ